MSMAQRRTQELNPRSEGNRTLEMNGELNYLDWSLLGPPGSTIGGSTIVDAASEENRNEARQLYLAIDLSPQMN